MLRVEGLQLRAGDFRLREIDLHVAEGEYFVLMGATGSGKSLLIKSICGLTRPPGGRIGIDGRDVTRLEPRRRHVGYVPQDGALFGHLSVAKNLTFAPRVAGARHAAALRKLAPLIEMLSLGPLLARSPGTLSGGERQKVALARALAAHPKLLLLDEPVSALDEPTRREICEEIRRVQRQLGVTTIHVCHNLEEASSVSDRVGVMHGGRLVQVGPLATLRESPATPAVARLLNVHAQSG